MSDMKKTGVYFIVNKVTRAVYVGSAAVSFQKRWIKHLSVLRRGVHDNPRLQSAWNKYGEAAFTFQIVEVVDNRNAILAREQEWLDACLQQTEIECYNATPVAGSMLGFKFSEASRALMSRAMKGRKQSPEHINRRIGERKVTYRFVSPDGYLYDNITDLNAFCAEHDLNVNSMRGVHSGRLPSCKRWTKSGYELRLFHFISPDGQYHLNIENLADFCRQWGLDFSCMARVHRGENRHHHGWTAYREEEL